MKYRQVPRKFTEWLAVSENPMTNDPGDSIEDSRGSSGGNRLVIIPPALTQTRDCVIRRPRSRVARLAGESDPPRNDNSSLSQLALQIARRSFTGQDIHRVRSMDGRARNTLDRPLRGGVILRITRQRRRNPREA